MSKSALYLLLCIPFVTSISSAQPAVAEAPPAQGLHCTIAVVPYTDADKAYVSGEFTHAEELFAAQLAATPTPANYAGLVKSQLNRNQLPEAFVTAQRATAALPRSADAQGLLGDVLARSGQVPEAANAYAKALALDRCSARAHLGLGRLHDLAGRHASAARELGFAHRLAPADPEITTAFLDNLPPLQRAAPLRSFLAEHPKLPPAELGRLATQAALLDRHATCTPSEAFTTAKLDLYPVLLNGRDTRGWGLKLRINDAAMPLLELDSSVAGIVLNPKDADAAGVHPLNSAKPGSPNATYSAVADHIRIGSVD